MDRKDIEVLRCVLTPAIQRVRHAADNMARAMSLLAEPWDLALKELEEPAPMPLFDAREGMEETDGGR